jgi:HopA1 effector protein family
MSSYQKILTEIVEKIEIFPDLSVRHVDYPPLEFPVDSLERIQNIPPQLTAKYLNARVQNYLYDIYFSHSLMSLAEIEIAAQKISPTKNNTIDGIDIDFYQQLQQHNSSKGYLDPDWQIVAETDRGELIVVKDGLHLHIDRQYHLPPELKAATIADIVTIYLPPNLVDRDTYIIVGNAGSPDRDRSIQIYFNFTPDAAISIAQKLTWELNQLAIPFQFAILHNPELFYRYDAGTLWLSQAGYFATRMILAQIYRSHQAQFFSNIPIFSKQLAPGLGLVEVPTTSVTFGMQRCELIATGLLTAMAKSQTLAADKLHLVRQEFADANIDWRQPYLNSSASDADDPYAID